MLIGNLSRSRNRAFVIAGLGVLLIAIFLSPFASSDPDGLDRVSQDLKFQDRAVEDAPAKKYPLRCFEEYALRGVPEELLPIGRFDRNASNIWLGGGIGKLVIQFCSDDASRYPDDSDYRD